ncbi:NUDIX domain-containing protein [Rhodococcus sp. RS1C4]|uniref:NUDIX hydrolase n=1 Tax=Nocardiaceae TaxID=85025 RepID=UPI000377D964|nr:MULTISPECIES: NUDIX domain-containing protein [Rhodococcus]OZC43992.1 NUDIX domain-containing protein [Rhodococcus sp. RS1C4]OZC62404.1 NUDIX domain-containing protein [Rhodococcus sp. 06-621-2]OZC79796.1 NUDIX domain-containing protein [Rhodococcus sp. 06-418-1B]OZD19244.1 NUDIX domain-containing protein [Rhodococcus sp. 06-156-3C]OZD21578.1 NUDIX domain-containing protein [Rhodococcus sp. 06-156-4C]
MPIPEFVLALRDKVGTSPLWLSGVSAVVISDGKVLLTQRRDNGKWAVVSGILEPGEEPGPAALREIREEAGIDAELVRLTGVDVTEPITYPNGDVAQYLDITFLAHHTGGHAHVADDENLAVAWFDPAELPDNLADTSRLRIHHALGDNAEAWFRR